MVTCGRCGAENASNAAVCGQCNNFLSWDDPTLGDAQHHGGRAFDPQQIPSPVPLSTPDRPASTPRVAPDPAAPPPNRPSEPRADVNDIIRAIDEGRDLAAGRGRADLEQHLGRTRDRLAADPVPVVVVGEFKMGKSTLINALLQADICAVDADVITAVPTMVRYAEHAEVTRNLLTKDGEVLDEERMPLDAMPALVTEQAGPGSTAGQRTVTVGYPHRMLAAGLALVDTPGVGGLDSHHGQLTLGALRQAEGALFVTDAAQELTQPELEFLRTSAERCPRIALVVTKVDIFPHWRRLVEINREHLQRAGLAMPVIPVSSYLRLSAANDPDLNLESGFGDLVAFLARDVVLAARRLTARSAAAEVDFVATQLQQQTQAERTVMAAPAKVSTVVAQLDAVQQEAMRLAAPTANWQTILSDGITQLEADVTYDILTRLKAVIREGEEIIDRGDPQDTWDDTEVWLRRQLAKAVVDNRDQLTSQAEDLAARVALQFAMPSSANLESQTDMGDHVDALSLGQVPIFSNSATQPTSILVAARSGYLPIMLGTATVGAVPVVGGAATVLTGGAFAPFMVAIFAVSAALGDGIDASTFSSERLRQRTARQAAARLAVQRFVRDDVSPVVSKQTADALRRIRQLLRDDFLGRAQQLQRTARDAITAARQAEAMPRHQQQSRKRDLEDQQRRLDEVRTTARQVVAEGVHG